MFKNFLEKYGKSCLTVDEVAVEMGITVDKVMVLIQSKVLPSLNVGDKPIVSIEAFCTFLSGPQNDSVQSLEKEASSRYNTTNSNDGWVIDVQEIKRGEEFMAKGSVSYIEASKRWVVQIDMGKTPDGKRIRKSKSFKTEEEARNALAVEQANFQQAEVQQPKAPMLYSELVTEFFSEKRITGEDRTWDTYREYSKHPITYFGDKYITGINKQDVIAMFNKLKLKYRDNSLKKIKITAGVIFDYAIEMGYINGNPVKEVKKLPKSVVSANDGIDPNKALSDEDLTRVISCAKNCEDMQGMVNMLAFTGMRPGELRALKVSDIDLDNCVVKIRRAASFSRIYDANGKVIGKKEYVKDTKNGSYAHRDIKVPREILESALKQHQRMVDDPKYRGSKDTEFLFPSRDGTLFRESAFSSRWQKFRNKYGLEKEKFWPYVFRHTMCTNLIKSGQPLKVVQRIMGDNTIDIIMETYTHITQSDTDKSMGVISESYMSLLGNNVATSRQPEN